jgi:hypothetical protein
MLWYVQLVERTLVRATRWIGLMIVMTVAASTPAAADPLPGGPAPAPPLPTEIQPPVAGTVTTLGASGVLSTSAVVSGSYRAYDRPVTLAFEYGTTSAYGQHTDPWPRPTATEGGPFGFVATLMGLAPQTTYHYRIAVTSDLGTFSGEDQSFTTTAEGPVRGQTGGSVLVADRQAAIVVGCTGEAENSCVGSVRVSAKQTVGRGHHRRRRVVSLGTGSFSFSTGPFTPQRAPTALLVYNSQRVPLTLTPVGRALITRHRHLWATATLSIQRGEPKTQRVLVRPDTAARVARP